MASSGAVLLNEYLKRQALTGKSLISNSPLVNLPTFAFSGGVFFWSNKLRDTPSGIHQPERPSPTSPRVGSGVLVNVGAGVEVFVIVMVGVEVFAIVGEGIGVSVSRITVWVGMGLVCSGWIGSSILPLLHPATSNNANNVTS